ncbi:protein argonaute 4A-like isoform X5 [Castanea sativa]|uniref:protein argonaute 4A-like isoform X5 n=1 Tax=Castanea sativa TaxID=21020 RepID=UPI003F64B489
MEKSRQKPQERMKVLSEALKCNKHDSEPLLHSCGILISTSFTQEYGRVLPAPRLKVGNGEDFFPRNGRWNFNNKKLVQPTKIESWAVVIFSARSDTQSLVQDLLKCGDLKGIQIDAPFDVFQENPHNRCALLMARVEKMFQGIQSKLPGAPQCIAPTRVNDQYLTNVLLKINAKQLVGDTAFGARFHWNHFICHGRVLQTLVWGRGLRL